MSKAASIQQLIDRFYSKYIRLGLDDCWNWTDAPSNGYGRFRIYNKSFGAHVIAFELANDRLVEPGMHILHSCNNKLCVNPAHLREGTRTENLLEAMRDGLVTPPSGADHYQSAKTMCPEGHPYSGDNLVYKAGRRCCRECGNQQSRDYYRRRSQRERGVKSG